MPVLVHLLLTPFFLNTAIVATLFFFFLFVSFIYLFIFSLPLNMSQQQQKGEKKGEIQLKLVSFLSLFHFSTIFIVVEIKRTSEL